MAAHAVCQVLSESYSSSGPYNIRTAVKAAFIQLLSVFIEKLRNVTGHLVSCQFEVFDFVQPYC